MDRRAFVVALTLASSCAHAHAHAQGNDALRVTGAVEAGVEGDSNAHRAYSEQPLLGTTPAAVARAALRAKATFRPMRSRSWELSALVAGKHFAGAPGVADEDVLVVGADARFVQSLGERPAALALHLSLYDALERDDGDGEEHDFRTGDATASLTLLREGAPDRATLSVGYRAFRYKPDGDYDFGGEHLGLAVARRWPLGDLGPVVALGLDYTASRRGYAGEAWENRCPADAMVEPACLFRAGVARGDLLHVAAASLGWSGDRLVDLRYELSLDDSTSFGQSFLRHRVELGLTTDLLLRLVLTARLTVQLTQFLDPVLFARDVGVFTIEDENRNSLLLHLARDLGERVALEARLALHANELATDELGYRRITAYAGVVWRFGAPR